ncbi:Biogenesis of lysosome-related organelles complex 1 subunit 1 [Acorus calamus]|uniref:Biogenesis of lysosome-related organelles complex 1 subunit 1 n=1 Tax=Acorus calamus TaxID=4465 RepID=A0AAV9C6Z1_ACOCL|nr:Biogenesis of lysosome-related organelles complex 1 subunit 1 [Acorus calamus]
MEKPRTAEAGGGGIESSLQQLIQHHHQISLQIQRQTEWAKNDALKSAERVSGLLVDSVNMGVEECFVNEKHIEAETRAMLRTVAQYSRQMNRWLAASHALNSVLKEIGDFENWMKIMDYDCKSINAAIRNIHQS